MENIEFVYLYRDGGNYKKFGRVVFSNPASLAIDLIAQELLKALLPDRLFIAQQVRVPEAFLYAGEHLSLDDHCYHEFDAVRLANRSADDLHSRSIGQFLVEFAEQAARGWQPFDPCDSPGSFGWLLASGTH
ncbi:MAG: hypothetical protein ACRD2U_13425 [Terriglobales bacterium]